MFLPRRRPQKTDFWRPARESLRVSVSETSVRRKPGVRTNDVGWEVLQQGLFKRTLTIVDSPSNLNFSQVCIIHFPSVSYTFC